MSTKNAKCKCIQGKGEIVEKSLVETVGTAFEVFARCQFAVNQCYYKPLDVTVEYFALANPTWSSNPLLGCCSLQST